MRVSFFGGVHPWFLLRCPTHNCTLDIFGCSLRAVLDMCFSQPHLSLDPYRVTDSKDPWWSLWMISFLHVRIHVYTAIHTAFSGNIRHVHNFHTGFPKMGDRRNRGVSLLKWSMIGSGVTPILHLRITGQNPSPSPETQEGYLIPSTSRHGKRRSYGPYGHMNMDHN